MNSKNGILFSKLFWPSVRKTSDRETKLKFEAEGRKSANFLRNVKAQNNLEGRMLFKLFHGCFSDLKN